MSYDMSRQAGTEKIEEITPDMIDAGIEVLLAHYPDSASGDQSDRRLIEAIYLAMSRVSPIQGKKRA